MLRDRMYDGMKAAWKATKRMPVNGWDWRIEPVKLPPRKEAELRRGGQRKAPGRREGRPRRKRNNAAFQLAWLKRQIGRST